MERKRSRSRSPNFLSLQSSKDTSVKYPPWVSKQTLRLDDPLLMLHEEIIDFYHMLQPGESDVQSKDNLLLRLNSIVESIWPGTSFQFSEILTSTLRLRGSQINLVLPLQANPEFLESIAQKLLSSRSITELERLYTMASPSLKIKDSVSNLSVCISFEPDYNETVLADYLHAYPESKYIFFVMKYFLVQRGLTEQLFGGIGDYLLFCMVISSLQHSLARRGMRHHYGRFPLSYYLLHFLKTYGDHFNYPEVGIKIEGSGRYLKKPTDEQKPESLYLECPRTLQNIGRDAFKIEYAKKAFVHAHNMLCAQDQNIAKTPLQAIIRSTDEFFLRRKLMSDT